MNENIIYETDECNEMSKKQPGEKIFLKTKFENDVKCKICYLYRNPIDSTCDLISPCGCKGSIKYVHKTCLKLWRFKGKNLREIKKCEQCFCEYKIDDDLIPHQYLIRLTSIFAMTVIYFLSNFIINLFIEAITYEYESKYFSNLEQEMIYCIFKQKLQKIPNFFQNFQSSGDKEFLKIGYLASTVIAIIFYQIVFRFKFFPVFNYIFAIWRIFHFDFTIDYFILYIMSFYYTKMMYNDIYEQTDYIFVFLLNYR
ncbi:RING-variant domain-containing protein [Hamiltosporidium magnivora]|uniref:RING-variant domain-containing protein n=1 Tax=Hamiltosporidium magnivora TaxID=148818 RepID=A0A4Q9LL01_9MICR|nr:RING-variant domain-containing protein [Hamiltosporidium magnivora]